jgi:hypothetical protein
MADAAPDTATWFAVRSVFEWRDTADDGRHIYEERITLWRADDFDHAFALAEQEAADYVADTTGQGPVAILRGPHGYRLDLGQAPGHGAVVFKGIRFSELQSEEFMAQAFNPDIPTDG